MHSEQTIDNPLLLLRKSIYAACETYANVHRGSGHNSKVTTHLYEHARTIVLSCTGFSGKTHTVIFCSPRRAALLQRTLKPGTWHSLSSNDFGLAIGVRAIVVQKKALPKEIPDETGGGTASLVSPGWVLWAGNPDRFEPGTPAIIPVITFARALQLISRYGSKTFSNATEPDKNNAFVGHRENTPLSAHSHHKESQEPLFSNSGENIAGDNNYSALTGIDLFETMRDTVIGKDSIVPTIDGPKRFINLDNGASTRTFPPVYTAFCDTLCQSPEVQQRVVTAVRSQVLSFLDALPSAYDVIFTSNTTESVNRVAYGFAMHSTDQTEMVIVNSLLEHNSNELPWRMVPNATLVRMSVDEEGFISHHELETILREYNHDHLHGNRHIKLVALSGASNVLGTCNDLAKICTIVHEYGAELLVDAAQLVAHRQLSMTTIPIDYLVFSAHKMYAPFGTGVLIARKGAYAFCADAAPETQFSGDENAAGIAALGKAIELLQRIGMDIVHHHEAALTHHLLTAISSIPGIRIHGIKQDHSSHHSQRTGVVSFHFDKVMPSSTAQHLSTWGGLGIRYGCHCAHMLVKKIHKIGPLLEKVQWVIQKLFPRFSLPGVVRISLSIENSTEDLDRVITLLKNGTGRTKAKSMADYTTQTNAFIETRAVAVYGSEGVCPPHNGHQQKRYTLIDLKGFSTKSVRP